MCIRDRLTEALAKTVDSLNSYIQDIQTSLGSLSSGDYAIAIPDNFDGDFISIRDSLSDITDSLNKTMLRMNDSSSAVNQNSTEVSNYARQLFDGSQNQATLLKTLESSMQAVSYTHLDVYKRQAHNLVAGNLHKTGTAFVTL